MKKSFKYHWMLICCLSLIFAQCKIDVPAANNVTEVEQGLQQLLDAMLEKTNLPGVSLHVESPDYGISWSGAAGSDQLDSTTVLSPEQAYRIASVTKTFVAASILKYHEQSKLSIDDPISKYISKEHIAILEGGGYHPDKILIKHCLNHTSGLFDYAMGNQTYANIATKNPKKRWTRTEQLQGAMEWGPKQGYPGEVYHYSDTGYILLGEILEILNESNLGEALRSILNYEKLGIANLFLQSIEEAPAGSLPYVKRYTGKTDRTDWDNSIDLYGGGGLVGTSKDIAKFYYALFNNQVFEKEATLKLMLTEPTYGPDYDPVEAGAKHYHYGVYSYDVFGVSSYVHSGFWGTHVAYIPAYKASFAFNFTSGRNEYFMKRIYKYLHDYQKSQS